MDGLNRPRTRSAVFYTSIFIVLIAGVGLFAAYQMQDSFSHPQEAQDDPSKKFGTGDGPSKNPVTIDALDKPSATKP
jgi:hypothetical protein